MFVQQIRIGRDLQHLPDVVICCFSVPQADIVIRDPCPTPSGMSAAVGQAVFQGLAAGLSQFRGAVCSNLSGGVQPIQMGNMAVSGFCFLVFLHPFHQTSVTADPVGRQSVVHFADCSHQFLYVTDFRNLTGFRYLFSQFLPGSQASFEQIPQNLIVHGCTDTAASFLSIRQDICILR